MRKAGLVGKVIASWCLKVGGPRVAKIEFKGHYDYTFTATVDVGLDVNVGDTYEMYIERVSENVDIQRKIKRA